jgi:hypothetical protein
MTMSDFMLLFRASPTEQDQAMGTPERAQQSLQAWLGWIRELEAGGHLKDRGQPLEREGKIVHGPDRRVTDGPYVEAKDMVLGYIIVEAPDLERAAEHARGCPILAGTGSVEVRPVRQISM